jgi:hypothetical protein
MTPLKPEPENCKTNNGPSTSSSSISTKPKTGWRSWMDIHPAAEEFPLAESDIHALAADIKKNGQREPAYYIRGDKGNPVLLDGRHRLDARELLGKKIELNDSAVFQRLGGPDFDPVAFIISKNIHRRHLAPETKRDLILRFADWTKSDRTIAEDFKSNKNTVGRLRQQAAATVPTGTVEKRVGKDGKTRKRPPKKPKATKPEPVVAATPTTTEAEPKVQQRPVPIIDDDTDGADEGDGPQQFWERSLANMAGDAISLEAAWTRQHGAVWKEFPVPRDLATLAREAADAWNSLAEQLDARVVSATTPTATAADVGLDVPDNLRPAPPGTGQSPRRAALEGSKIERDDDDNGAAPGAPAAAAVATAINKSTLRESQAFDRMRTGSRLVHMHAASGGNWFVVPGGAVTDEVATKIRSHASVVAQEDGLFPGLSQTWRMQRFVGSTAHSDICPLASAAAIAEPAP